VWHLNIDEFVKKIEGMYNVKVINYEFYIENGWNPLIISVSNEKMNKFVNKFVPPNEFMGVRYYVQENNIYFFSKVGNNIVNMLRGI
jgi:hypothetical protein